MNPAASDLGFIPQNPIMIAPFVYAPWISTTGVGFVASYPGGTWTMYERSRPSHLQPANMIPGVSGPAFVGSAAGFAVRRQCREAAPRRPTPSSQNQP